MVAGSNPAHGAYLFCFLKLLRSGFFYRDGIDFFFFVHGDIALSGPIEIYEKLLAFR